MRESCLKVSPAQFLFDPFYEKTEVWDLKYISTSDEEDNDSSESEEEESESDEETKDGEKTTPKK